MNMGQRPQGVMVPVSQTRDQSQRVTPGKVLSAVPISYVGVEYGNERGEVVKEVWLLVAGTYYRADNAEAFARSLRPIKDSHGAQVDALLSALTASYADLPAGDTVDVISRKTAEQGHDSGVDV
jgi:hypothetical protein